ncbi:MAG: hypothetical protein ACLPVO_05265 [Desulfomonilaceae bacterium]
MKYPNHKGTMANPGKNDLPSFGFTFQKGGVHLARTMMLGDLETLLDYVPNVDAARSDYFRAVVDDNCLGKRSVETRKLTERHLVELYALDPQVIIFRALRYFWKRESLGHALLALLCAYARDSLLRISAPFIMGFHEGDRVQRLELEDYIEKTYPGRFSKAMLKSLAQNLNSTWTKSGHLVGRSNKFRSKARASTGTVSYALLLGYLRGDRGKSLFESEYMKLLDCSFGETIELAEPSALKGWIIFKRLGAVIEVLFPNLLTDKEMELIREQDQKTN